MESLGCRNYSGGTHRTNESSLPMNCALNSQHPGEGSSTPRSIAWLKLEWNPFVASDTSRDGDEPSILRAATVRSGVESVATSLAV